MKNSISNDSAVQTPKKWNFHEISNCLQWSLNNWEDFDSLVRLEKLMIENLSSDDFDVDGHDSGSGEMNIFIETNLPPSEAFSNIEGVSKESKHWC
ncbi:MAG TPA: hypothetical protein PKK45_20970, partial [Leptospiraceae bacterium]|nr:hypothetical protein [Leptospiraceae bacterium]